MGIRVVREGDLRGQMESALANIDMPPQTLLGVSRLALPALLIEIEATAGA